MDGSDYGGDFEGYAGDAPGSDYGDSAPAGVAGGPSLGADGGASDVGSAAWYASEIASREATAAATTESSPGTANLGGAPGSGVGTATYTDPRTGMTFATEAIAASLGYGSPLSVGSRTDAYARAVAAIPTRSEQELYMARHDDPYGARSPDIGVRLAGQPSAQSMAAVYLNRPDIYAVTDPKQIALMGTGLTSYQAAERLKYEAQQEGKFIKSDYYENLRTQAWTTKTGKSAAEHTWGRDTGLPQRANPYEYTADLFTYAEKGYPTRGKDVFSPVDFNVLGLPGGKGGQDYIWGNEKYDLRGAMDVIAKAERSGDLGPYGALRSFSSGYGNLPLSMQQSIGAQAAESRGEKVSFTQWGLSPEQMGVGKYVPSILKNIAGETAPLNKISSAGLPTPFLSTFEPTGGLQVKDVTRPSDFGLWAMGNTGLLAAPLIGLSDFFIGGQSMEREVVKTLKGVTTTEMGKPWDETKEISPGVFETTTFTPSTTTTTGGTLTTKTVTPIPRGFDIGEEQFTKRIMGGLPAMNPAKPTGNIELDYVAGFGRGAYEGVRTKPLTSLANVGIGLAFVAGGELIAGLGAGAVAATTGMRILGPVARGTTFLATKAAPASLMGLYGVDVAGRTTSWGKDTSYQAAERFGGITSTEILPMMVGGFAYRPIATKIGLAEIGYKGALLKGKGEPLARIGEIGERTAGGAGGGIPERATNGRVDYYVKQPITEPLMRAKIDYLAMKQEGFVKTPTEYAKMQLVDRPVNYFKAGIQEMPGLVKQIKTDVPLKAYTKVFDMKMGAQARAEGALVDYYSYTFKKTPEPNLIGYAQSKVYPAWFEAKTTAPIKAEQALISGEVGIWKTFQHAKNPVLSAKAYWQERGGTVAPSMGSIPKGEPSKPLTRTGWKPEPSATGTKTVGGKTVSGLPREPSLKSMGIKESAGTATSPFKETVSKRSVDFRGQQSQAMKPMRDIKQASSALSIMAEELPGMKPASAPARQMSAQKMPVPMMGLFQTQVPRTRTQIDQIFEEAVQQDQRQRKDVSFFSISPKVQIQTPKQVSQARQTKAMGHTFESAFFQTVGQTVGTRQTQESSISTISRVGITQVPRTTTTTRTTTDIVPTLKITKFTTKTPPPTIPGGWDFGGAQIADSSQRRGVSKKHREYIPISSSLGRLLITQKQPRYVKNVFASTPKPRKSKKSLLW